MSRTTWRIQIAGWFLYGAIHFLAALPAVAPEDRETLALVKLIRAVTGLAVSSLLPLLYARVIRRSMAAVVALALA
ncbi:MAG: hypothetical protein ACRENS_11950, partial [Candidatus Eiseniibacteriota bacterium]